MIQNLHRHCPICAHSTGEKLRHQEFGLPAGHTLGSGYDVVACEKCGFVFADTRATNADYERFYAEFSKYDDVQTATGGGGTPTDWARIQETAAQIAHWETDRTTAILDAGCATGGVLRALKLSGFQNLRGLDPSPSSAVFARREWEIEITTGSLLCPPAIGKFGGVIVSHVLEHLLDLQTAARELANLVGPNGWLYAEVPDAARYTDFIVAPFQDFNAEHINHFGLNALDDLLSPVGLKRGAFGHKTIFSAPDSPYPALWAFYRLENAAPPVFARDEALVKNIRQYIARSQAILDDWNARLETALNRKIIVWGAGQMTLRLLAETCLSKAEIVCFVDANPLQQGKTLHGAPIVAPDAIRERNEPILVASTIHQAAIVARIREKLGLKNELIVLRDESANQNPERKRRGS